MATDPQMIHCKILSLTVVKKLPRNIIIRICGQWWIMCEKKRNEILYDFNSWFLVTWRINVIPTIPTNRWFLVTPLNTLTSSGFLALNSLNIWTRKETEWSDYLNITLLARLPRRIILVFCKLNVWLTWHKTNVLKIKVFLSLSACSLSLPRSRTRVPAKLSTNRTLTWYNAWWYLTMQEVTKKLGCSSKGIQILLTDDEVKISTWMSRFLHIIFVIKGSLDERYSELLRRLICKFS